MDFELLAVLLFNGAILAYVVWILVRWRRQRRAFTRQEGARQALVRWRYPVEEWQRFCDAEAKRMVREILPAMMLVFAIPAVVMVAATWWMYDASKTYIYDPRLGIWWLLALVAVILVAIVLWKAWDFAKLRGLDAEIAIGREGVYETYTRHGEVKLERKTLFGPDYDLAGCRLGRDGDYRYLALRLRGHRGASAERRIPVPRGHEPQAERVAQSLMNG